MKFVHRYLPSSLGLFRPLRISASLTLSLTLVDAGDEIRMDLKDGWNQWYRGFYFSMTADLIDSVKLDGRHLTPSQFGFWEDFSGSELGDGPHTFEFTSVTGETLRTTIEDVMKPTQYLNIQFTARQ